MAEFLGVERLSLGSWQAFERAVQRMFVHAGFGDVRLVGGTGDHGADVVGELNGQIWIAQAKFRSAGQLVATEPIDEVTIALDRYGGQVGLVVSNTGFAPAAIQYARKRSADIGLPIYLWNHDVVRERMRALPLYPEHRTEPRPYQADAISAINERIAQGGRTGLLLMATGLGKTRVAAAVIEQWLVDRPGQQVLVLAPTLALVYQLEAALWPFLPKVVPTHVMTGSEKPAFEGGVTFATEQSMVNAGAEAAGRYPLVVIDEAHHAPADGYRKLIQQLDPSFLLGMTATPWRGDDRQLDAIFGEPTYAVSVVDGMQQGYLAQVDYRMLIDDLNWDWIREDLHGSVSIRDLNQKLFLPERDEAAIAKIRDHMRDIADPRAVIFCRSIEHAGLVGRLLQADGISTRVLHSDLDRVEATRALHDFRAGVVPVIVTVDMLNEGIDIPEVNMIVFLRVTHSRRIFVQQLGRGLRLAEGKSTVRVLDFVSDVRRIAAAMDINQDATAWATRAGPDDRVVYKTGAIVHFDGDAGVSFFDESLADVAELEESTDETRLRFPG